MVIYFFAGPVAEVRFVGVTLIFSVRAHAIHPHGIGAADFQSLVLPLVVHSGQVAVVDDGFVVCLGLLSFVPVLHHVVYQLIHTFFAFEAGGLNALKALSVGLFPENLLLVGQHRYYSSFYRLKEKKNLKNI